MISLPKKRLYPIIPMIGAIIVWHALLHKPLYYDDLAAIAWNEKLEDPANAWRMLTDYQHISGEATFRPLVTWSYFIDTWLGGHYQTTNLLLHSLTVLAFFLLLSVYLDGPLACLMSLTAAVHPLAANCVAFPGFREDILAALFGLLSVRWWIALLRRPSSRRLAGCVICYALALAAKETAWLLPLVFLAAQRAENQAAFSARTAWRWAPIAVVGLLFLLIYCRIGSADATPDYFGDGYADRLLTIGRGLGRSLLLVFLPIDQRLVYDFFSPATPQEAWPGLLLFTLATLGTLGLTLRRSPAALGGWLYLAAYLPATNLLIPIRHVFDERYLYFPMFGLLFIAALGIARLMRKHPPLTQPLAMLVGLALLIFTASAGNRAQILADPAAAWSEAATRSPNNPLAWNSLATIDYQEMLYDSCAAAAEKALALSPTYANARENLERCLFHAKKYEPLMELLAARLAQEPGSTQTVSRYAACLSATGRCAELKNLLEAQPAPLSEQLKALLDQCRALN